MLKVWNTDGGFAAQRKTALRVVLAAVVWLTGCGRRETVEPAVGLDSPERTWVRVLLFGNLRECTVAFPAGFTAEGLTDGVTAEFSDTEPMQIGLQDGRLRIGAHRMCGQVVVRPKDPFYFEIDGRGFRGNLYLRVGDDGQSFDAINHLPVESYLLGVVGAEMHSYWEPEALKTQAVAARTYCLAVQHRFGSGRAWDLTRTQANQVYEGLSAENPRIRQAVLETTGQIMVAPDDSGKQTLFAAYYSSSCGGHTEDSQHVFGTDAVHIAGVKCPWCEAIARRRDFHWKPVYYAMDEVHAKLTARYPSLLRLERVVDIEVMRTGWLGRITMVQVIGVNGLKDTLRGEDFRLALDSTGRRLKSALAAMDKVGGGLLFSGGRGFGHGVGLCQCGAQGMARDGRDYTAILAFYFPDSKLVAIETAAAP